MKKTREEVIKELRHRFGQREHTEHLIDWVLDCWETCDFLSNLLSQEYAHQVLEAVETFSPDIRLHEIVLYTPTHEEMNTYSLN